jgi:hypothetical protein
VLFGITFGERKAGEKNERHAYNWYLNWDDLTKIVFFDPIKNHESGRQPQTLSLHALGHELTDHDRTDDGWNYRGFNGIF